MPRKLPQDDLTKKGDPYGEGYDAHGKGIPITKNPYKEGTWHRRRWSAGWRQANADAATML